MLSFLLETSIETMTVVMVDAEMDRKVLMTARD